MSQDNPYSKGTARYRRRRIRNLLGFDAGDHYGEPDLRSHELKEILRIVEDAVENADTSEKEVGVNE